MELCKEIKGSKSQTDKSHKKEENFALQINSSLNLLDLKILYLRFLFFSTNFLKTISSLFFKDVSLENSPLMYS